MRAMSLMMFLGAGLLDNFAILGASSIPTKEEQANLLLNVQEVFEQVTILVNQEANDTDLSVNSDIDKIIKRAKDHLTLMQELALTKMSCRSNSVCTIEHQQSVQQLVKDADGLLRHCTLKCLKDVHLSSQHLTNVTVSATERGQDLLDSLYECSRKPGLHVISCYKDIIAKDVEPVKKMLLNAIEEHKAAHVRTIGIREAAGDCVDDVVAVCGVEIDKAVEKGLRCT